MTLIGDKSPRKILKTKKLKLYMIKKKKKKTTCQMLWIKSGSGPWVLPVKEWIVSVFSVVTLEK